MKAWGRWNKDSKRSTMPKIGVTITWLWDGGVDMRLPHVEYLSEGLPSASRERVKAARANGKTLQAA